MSTLKSFLLDDDFDLIDLVLFLIMGFGIGAGLVGGSVRNLEHKEAIKAGVGQYTTNPKTGETTFVYGVVKQ